MTEAVATETTNVQTPAATPAAAPAAGTSVPTPAGAQQAGVAPAAPAVAPAAQPTGSEPANEPAAAEGVFGPAVTYQPTGHAGLDMAVKWLGDLGIDYDASPEAQAAYNGDFTLLKALLAGKGVQGADAYLALAESALKEIQGQKAEKEQAHVSEITAYATDLIGGVDAWNEVLDWTRQNVEGDEGTGINAALDAGGIQAQAMMLFLQQQMRSAADVSFNTTPPVAAKTAGATPGSGTFTPLSPQEYGRAVDELSRTKGRGVDITQSAEYKALQQRRMAFRG
ncbi:scaffolding-like protein [Ralstonia phage vB_RsoP_BMB50]|uniref:Scaffolding-like protein n=1 Tax=Ralstonia phage vB_RsoP_BMB50 TaxID=2834269 RepID=A0A8E5NW30_9CAUD|nr:scaffolding-like protein [Ralstonia phage vB_RsoP_BMB50]